MSKKLLLLLAAILTLAACNKDEDPAKPDPSATAEEFASVLTSSLNTVSENINPEDHRMIFRALGDFSKKIEKSTGALLKLVGKSTKASDGTVIDVNELLTNYKYKFTYSYIAETFLPSSFKQDKMQFVWDLEKKGGEECDLSMTAGGTPRSFTFKDTTYIVPTQVYVPLTVANKSQMTVDVKDTFSEGKSDALTVTINLNGGYVLKVTYNVNQSDGNFECVLSKAGESLVSFCSSFKGQNLMDILPAILTETDPSEVLRNVESADINLTVDRVSITGPVQVAQLLKDIETAETPAQKADVLNKNVTLVGKTADKVYCDIKATVDSATSALTASLKFGDGTEVTVQNFLAQNPSLITPVTTLAAKVMQYVEMYNQYFAAEQSLKSAD